MRIALNEGIYLIKLNLRELAELAECSVDDEADQDQIARSFVEAGKTEIVALTLGEKGALLAWNGGTLRLRPPPVKAQSAVGAGDSFLGGFMVGLVRDLPLTDCFRLAISAGAAALLTPGTELCRPEDVMRLYRDTIWQDLVVCPAG